MAIIPRVLACDLDRLAAGETASPAPWLPADADLARAAAAGAGALGLLLLLERVRAGRGAEAFVVAVGNAVRRGLPTAARTTVAARAPLHGGFAEGLVGGDLGRRLARVADAVVIEGELPGGAGVLVIDAQGRAALARAPELRGLDPRAAHAALAARFGPAATLRVGPAAEHGARVASLASGGAEASFVGRGGLGAAFAAHGLKALVVQAPEVEATPDAELVRALASSPRLLARAADGTFELAHARAARGELGQDEARVLYEGARAAARERTGCAGCPTPCGWSFARPGAGPEPARFGKLWGLAAPLGLARFEDALELAAACDRAGVDAKETAAGLRLFAEARGDPARLRSLIEDLGRGSGPGWALAEGAAALARALGVGRAEPVEAAGPERGLAARLGAFISTNGADPMRTFPFLIEAGGGERLARLLAGVPLPEGALDPDQPAGKGRLVWWHENLAAALDATGFCAFSAAGLLSDGALDLDGLAARLYPDAGERPGRALLERGAALVGLRRELAERLGRAPRRPPPELAGRGLFPEYERWRALGWAAAEVEDGVGAAAPPAAAGARRGGAPGVLVLRTVGPLARRLGAEVRLELAGPRPLGELLGELGAERGAALVRDGVLLASAYRGGRRLDASDEVAPGDEVQLVVAIAGG